MERESKWSEELECLKSILNKTSLVETRKWGGVVYTYQNRNIVAIGGFKHFFTLWFYNGVFLKDEQQVLINANEEKTKALRQWRFTSKDEMNEAQILEYVNEAIKNEIEGKVWKPQKTDAPEIPEVLKCRFNTDALLEGAFMRLSSYKQKDYIDHLNTAKREETKLSRLEKMIPLIKQGVGLHDKYKTKPS